MRVFDRRRGFQLAGGRSLAALSAAALLVPVFARADSIGLSQLQALDPTLRGDGVLVAQVEAPEHGATPPDFEVNPADGPVSQPALLFTYISTFGASAGFPNAVGSESSHADAVGSIFYGATSGVAPNVSHVDNYEANFFIDHRINTSTNVRAVVFNQSFADDDGHGNTIQDPALDQAYDDYIANYKKVMVSAAGNAGKPASPSTGYNGISVGAYGGSSAVGPTVDSRSKPDIVAPACATSFSAPQVSGAAAILLQAGARGDGGSGSFTIANAQDPRVVKALLLNGAVKPSGWSHTPTAPLDATYGAGVLNIFNSYENLAAGMHARTNGGATATPGGGHVPSTAEAGTEASNVGWNFATLASSSTADAFDAYYFTLTTPSTLTATLDWQRQAGAATINNLDFYLYNVTTGTAVMVDQSVSLVDNVEHLYDVDLASGRYVLQVLKNGGVTEVSESEDYALAYNFVATPEPTSSLLAIGGGLMLLTRRRRQR